LYVSQDESDKAIESFEKAIDLDIEGIASKLANIEIAELTENNENNE